MKKIILISITIFLTFFKSNAEIANEIIFEGNTRISSETIKVYGDVKNNFDYKKEDINKLIKNLYSTIFLKTLKFRLKTISLQFL